MKNLKDNIWIEGMKSKDEMKYILETKVLNVPIYCGKTSEIPKEIAKQCAEIHQGLSYWGGENDIFFVDYKDISNGFSKAKNSIQSACPQEYCIIFRK